METGHERSAGRPRACARRRPRRSRDRLVGCRPSPAEQPARRTARDQARPIAPDGRYPPDVPSSRGRPSTAFAACRPPSVAASMQPAFNSVVDPVAGQEEVVVAASVGAQPVGALPWQRLDVAVGRIDVGAPVLGAEARLPRAALAHRRRRAAPTRSPRRRRRAPATASGCGSSRNRTALARTSRLAGRSPSRIALVGQGRAERRGGQRPLVGRASPRRGASGLARRRCRTARRIPVTVAAAEASPGNARRRATRSGTPGWRPCRRVRPSIATRSLGHEQLAHVCGSMPTDTRARARRNRGPPPGSLAPRPASRTSGTRGRGRAAPRRRRPGPGPVDRRTRADRGSGPGGRSSRHRHVHLSPEADRAIDRAVRREVEVVEAVEEPNRTPRRRSA